MPAHEGSAMLSNHKIKLTRKRLIRDEKSYDYVCTRSMQKKFTVPQRAFIMGNRAYCGLNIIVQIVSNNRHRFDFTLRVEKGHLAYTNAADQKSHSILRTLSRNRHTNVSKQ